MQVAVALEKAALSDEYFVKRKLYPNVDFYSSLIYKYASINYFVYSLIGAATHLKYLLLSSMGFPTEFFPVLFAIPRMAGYLAWVTRWSWYKDHEASTGYYQYHNKDVFLIPLKRKHTYTMPKNTSILAAGNNLPLHQRTWIKCRKWKYAHVYRDLLNKPKITRFFASQFIVFWFWGLPYVKDINFWGRGWDGWCFWITLRQPFFQFTSGDRFKV